MNLSPDSSSHLRRNLYAILIISSAATMVGRIMHVESKSGKTAMLSANDRSRWCTIRALVDHGTYEIDAVTKRKTDWSTIDRVRHKGRDGVEHDYSSKPPLLPTLLAGKYWLLKQVAGVGLVDSPFYVARIMLVTTNVLPLALYFVVLVFLVESVGTTDWGRVFVVAVATWGTFLSTFAVTLNNHLPAAISVLLAAYAAIRILHDRDRRVRWFAMAGGFSAFAVANELPALSLFAMLLTALLWKHPRQTLAGFVPVAVVVAVAFFSTNYIAHESLRPPYAHRSHGKVIASLPLQTVGTSADGLVSDELSDALVSTGIPVSPEAVVTNGLSADWMLWDAGTGNRYALLRTETGIGIREWDNWYEYEGSYWTPENKRGVDRGEPSRVVYAFHMLLGHRGVFSLTPIWLFSMAGIAIWLMRGEMSLRAFALMVLTLTLVCIAFYIMRPEQDRNYGGVSCGFRWLFWLIPLWLICLVPAADAIANHRSWKMAAWTGLAISILSATYASMNPWSQPWIFDYWTNLGWISY
jgi:hypothetical protein